MRIDNETQTMLMQFLETPVDLIINNGDTMPISPHYFLANFSMYYGTFARQQALTDFANALHTLAYQGQTQGKAEFALKNGGPLLDALEEHVRDQSHPVMPQQLSGLLSLIEQIAHYTNVANGREGEAHAR